MNDIETFVGDDATEQLTTLLAQRGAPPGHRRGG